MFFKNNKIKHKKIQFINNVRKLRESFAFG